MEIVYAVCLGFLIDLILGDPAWMPHPIVFIGKLISGTEKILRRLFPASPRGEMAGGFFLTLLVIGISTAVPLLILLGLGFISPWLRFAAEIIWCWQIFAARSLKEAALRVYREIKAENLPGARKYLSWIVGRDTGDLDFPHIIRAVVETVAENASDGEIAPMMYLMIFGVPGGFFYKAGNTLDSMVGYKNEKYLYFGRVSARFDDVLNWIPARLTGLLFCLGAAATGLDARGAWRIFRRDRMHHSSPNAGNPESACAGALGVQLLGPAYYFGEFYDKPTVGDDDRPVEPEDIIKVNRLMMAASVLSLVLMAAVRTAIAVLVFRQGWALF